MTFADLAAAATKDKEFAKEKKSAVAEEEEGGGDEDENVDVEATPDVHFVPIVKLEVQETKTLEEDEIELFKMRSKMFRFDKEINEWKERGTGEVRLLQHPSTGKIRLVMRREQTLKVCANHLVTSDITLRPNVGSDRSWVYNVIADISDGEPKPELFAIRFAKSENANEFKSKFEEAQKLHGIPPKKSEVENSKVKEDIDAEGKSCEAKEQSEQKLQNEDAIDAVQKCLESVEINDKKDE